MGNVPSLRAVRAVLRKEIGCEKRESIDVGTILLFAAYIGEDVLQLAKRARMSLKDASAIHQTLSKNQIFGTGQNHFKEFFGGNDGGIKLGLAIECGLGLLESRLKNGELAYKITPKGEREVEELLANKSRAPEKG
jgi:hypothetical protein